MVDQMSGASHDLVPTGLSLPEESCGGNWAAQGTWSGDRFYLYVACPNHPGFLWSVSPGATELGTEVQLDSFNQMPGCRRQLPVGRGLLTAGTDLFYVRNRGNQVVAFVPG